MRVTLGLAWFKLLAAPHFYARRDDNFDQRVTLRNSLEGRLSVTRTIGSDLRNSQLDLLKLWTQLERVINLLLHQYESNDPHNVGIHRQVPHSPVPARL
jgi:hypothetical protein